jgi:hypothetical protein
MGELIELIIRAIEALSGKKKENAPDPNWQAQQAEWERQRREWEAAQQRMQQQPVQQPFQAAPQPMAPTARAASTRKNRPARRPPPAVPPSSRGRVEELVETTELVEVQTAPMSRPVQRPKVTASAIAQWARPRTLKSQFILTEILKPPLSMRGQEAGRC